MSRSKYLVALVLVAAMSVQAAAQNPAAAPASAPAATARPPVLPGTPAAAFGSIQVSAMSAGNTPLPHWSVRLRDARYGRLIATNITDEAGTFTFRDVDPGSYIIELLGGDQTVRATSALLAVNAGALVFAVVKLPTNPAALAVLLGVAGVALGQAAAATVKKAAESAGIPAVQQTTAISAR
jgi:hypothetical protein